MPYTKPERREAINKTGMDAVFDFGDLNYFVTTIILKMWNTHPRYATIHLMRKELVTEPKKSALLQNLRTNLADKFDTADVYTAAALAFEEFYQRVGRLYEALKCRENGDVEGYPEAIKPLLEKLGSEIKKETVSGILLPGQEIKK